MHSIVKEFNRLLKHQQVQFQKEKKNLVMKSLN